MTVDAVVGDEAAEDGMVLGNVLRIRFSGKGSEIDRHDRGDCTHHCSQDESI
jgi:hypothetical protein